MRLENKVAFISGGARGMGAAEVRLFVREGARVAFGDLLESTGRDLGLEIQSAGGEALFVPMDVAKEEDWRQAIAATVERFGGLNILVNNAAILGFGDVEDTAVETWDEVMAVNARGVFLGTKAAIPEMRKSGGGSVWVTPPTVPLRERCVFLQKSLLSATPKTESGSTQYTRELS